MEINGVEVQIHNSVLSAAETDDRENALQVYFQQLWQMDNLVILVGAGFSREVDGPLMSDLSREILPEVVISGPTAAPGRKEWARFWSLSDHLASVIGSPSGSGVTAIRNSLSDHCTALNLEGKISQLQAVIAAKGCLEEDAAKYDEALDTIKNSILERIARITPAPFDPHFSEFRTGLQPYRSFLRRLISLRRPQQPRIKVFSTNYDTVLESACDSEGIQCVTGFDGQTVRLLNPTLFDLDTTFRGNGQASVYYSNVIHLYKLHGSIDWRGIDVEGVGEILQSDEPSGDLLIYPCYTKFAETLEAPYHEMFRRLGDATSQPQTVLLSIGYGFGDEHVNQMIMRAFKNPSCQLVLCEPRATDLQSTSSELLKRFLRLATSEPEAPISDPRVTVIAGDGATFPRLLKVMFPPMEVESPTDKVRNLVRQLLSLGER